MRDTRDNRTNEQFQSNLEFYQTAEDEILRQWKKLEYERHGRLIECRRVEPYEAGVLVDCVECMPDFQIRALPNGVWHYLEVKEVDREPPYLTLKTHQLKAYQKYNAYILLVYGTNRKATGEFSSETKWAIISPHAYSEWLATRPSLYYSCYPHCTSVRIFECEWKQYFTWQDWKIF